MNFRREMLYSFILLVTFCVAIDSYITDLDTPETIDRIQFIKDLKQSILRNRLTKRKIANDENEENTGGISTRSKRDVRRFPRRPNFDFVFPEDGFRSFRYSGRDNSITPNTAPPAEMNKISNDGDIRNVRAPKNGNNNNWNRPVDTQGWNSGRNPDSRLWSTTSTRPKVNNADTNYVGGGQFAPQDWYNLFRSMITTTASPAPVNAFRRGQDDGTTTAAPNMRDPCQFNCQRTITTEYNPVCGSDGITYSNPAKLGCAVQCGRKITLRRQSSCGIFAPVI